MRLGFIGDILRWALDLIYSLVGNYGWAVLIFTLLIRLLLLPLDIKSRRGMKRMQAVQPRIDELNKKYANDKEKLNQKMSDLYKKEKINPLSGCLPMLIQLPILFSMFAIMREVADEEVVMMILDIKQNIMNGIENYVPHLQGMLWIKNVFQPDSFMSTVFPVIGDSALATITKASGAVTLDMINEAKEFLQTAEYGAWAGNCGNAIVYSAPLLMWTINIPQKFNGLFILPVLSAVSQFFSSKFMNAGQQQPTNEQASSTSKFMQWFFPIFSLWICATSNAAFSMYWVFSNVFQVLQQFIVGKIIDKTDSKKTLIEEDKK